MRPKPRTAAAYEAGDNWLADCATHPDLVWQAWDMEYLAPIATGVHWLAAEVRLVPTAAVLKRIGTARLGPVLADPGLDLAWWLVPPGAAEDLADVRQVTVHPVGWHLHCPPTGWFQCGRLWLYRPDGTGALNDPVLLAAALGPGGGYRLTPEARA